MFLCLIDLSNRKGVFAFQFALKFIELLLDFLFLRVLDWNQAGQFVNKINDISMEHEFIGGIVVSECF